MLQQHFTLFNEEFYKLESDEFENYLMRFRRNMPKNPAILGVRYKDFLKRLYVESMCNPKREDCLPYLTLVYQAGTGFYQIIKEDGKDCYITFNGEKIVLKSNRDDKNLEIQNWFTHLFCAITARDFSATQDLLQIDSRLHVRSAHQPTFEFYLALKDVFIALLSNRVQCDSPFERLKWAFRPSLYSDTQALELAEAKFFPLISLLESLVSDESSDLYNEKLKQALFVHQAYWKNNDPENWEGAFSLPLMAVAVIAHDMKGYQVTVENDYIPTWINDGVENKLEFTEKVMAPAISASLKLASVADEKTQLEGKSLEEQLSHIEYYLDYFFRAEDSINSFEPMFPTLWQVYGKTPAYRFGGSGDELKQFIDEHLDALSKELDQMRTLFVSFYQQGER